ncbi:MAG: RNA methyltransferase [Bdellovibrionales bacterium]|nr:RNA methyltransferase [Bdellovibrionales bacterium]
MTKPSQNLSVALLHDGMHDKQGAIVTTSLTMMDVHDICRSCRTYGAQSFYIAHPSSVLRALASTLERHWKEGYGASYNPDRKDAFDILHITETLDQIKEAVQEKTGKSPCLVATSAHDGGMRVTFPALREQMIGDSDRHYLLLLGTGWGMSQDLLDQTDLFLEPIQGPTEYNHLSVRSACAIMLDRLFGT